MPEKPAVITANLGPKVAAFTTSIHGKPAAVVNELAARNPELRHQAVCALLGVGLDAGLILGALHGVRR
ncbi:hypothetical protein [Streptomyces sp. NPDC048338]|uniref:hypothetical protein n=1 Tax=Streptomyces sp. NPDC048338 TaxID=3365536 RepID=UPI00371EBDD2